MNQIEEDEIYDEYFGGDVSREKRTTDMYPDEQQKAMDNIAIQRDEIYPFGSASYRVIRWPGDLDLRELFKSKEPIDKIVKRFTSELQRLVKRITKEKLVYFSEVKCGFDDRYIINEIGDLRNGEVINYNAQIVRNKIKQLHSEKLLSKKEATEMLLLAVDNISRNQHDDLYDLLRDKWLLRWSAKEILQGYKDVPVGRFITLEDCLHDKTMVKIDTIMFLPNLYRFVEVTDFFILVNETSTGEYRMVNLPEDALDQSRVIYQLKKEVEKLYNSDKFRNPLKMLKRMFSIANIYGNQNDLEKIVSILNSDAGIVGQVISDIESLIIVLKGNKKPPITTIQKEINNFKGRLSGVTEFELNPNIFIYIDYLSKIKDKIILADGLKKLKDSLKLKMYKYVFQRIRDSLKPIKQRYYNTEYEGEGLDGGAGTKEGALKAWETRRKNALSKQKDSKNKKVTFKKPLPKPETEPEPILKPKPTKKPVLRMDNNFDFGELKEALNTFNEETYDRHREIMDMLNEFKEALIFLDEKDNEMIPILEKRLNDIKNAILEKFDTQEYERSEEARNILNAIQNIDLYNEDLRSDIDDIFESLHILAEGIKDIRDKQFTDNLRSTLEHNETLRHNETLQHNETLDDLKPPLIKLPIKSLIPSFFKPKK